MMLALRRQEIATTAAFLMLSFTAVPALAQVSAEQQSAIRSNCRSDFMSNCPGVKGGKDGLACLQQNVAKLSPGCKAAVSATMPAAPAPAASAPPPPPAPAAPAVSLPPPAPAAAKETPAAAAPAKPASPPVATKSATAPPATRPAPSPKQAPSAPASAVVTAGPPAPLPPLQLRQMTLRELAMVRRSCAGDIVVHCRNVPPGDGRIATCLAENGPALSPGCKRTLAPLQN